MRWLVRSTLLLLTTPTFAQVYTEFYWAPNHVPGGFAAISGPGLFSVPGGGVNYATLGDAIRRCYRIDQTQGGRNQSTGGFGPPSLVPGQPTALPGTFEASQIQLVQGYGPQSALGSPAAGFVSLLAATESDLGGDVCFAPFLQSAQNTGGTRLALTTLVGPFGGSPPPFPTVTLSSIQFSSTTGSPVPGPTVIGTDATVGNPLLANVILEVQGPLNGGPANNQYYLASGLESTGLGASFGGLAGTGGVTLGNADWGSSIFAVGAAASGAVSSSRVIATDRGSGTVTFGFYQPPGAPAGRGELVGMVGFATPSLWAENDGNEGAGAADWVVSTTPVSIVDLRAVDHLYGFRGDPSFGADPCVSGAGALNLPLFFWSSDAAASLQQRPYSWDDLGQPTGAQPGSFAGGWIDTIEEGPQTLPFTDDVVTATALTDAGISLGSSWSSSQLPLGFGTGLFEGVFTPIVQGVSRFSGGPRPAVPRPLPSLAGRRVGVAFVGYLLEAPGCPFASTVRATRVGSTLTIVFQ